MAREFDPYRLSNPSLFLLSMVIFLIITGFLAAILYRQILATAADIRNPEDPAHVIHEMMDQGRQLIAESNDELRKRSIEWKLGGGLAEAVRLQRQRGKADDALQLADEAMKLLRTSAKRRQSTPEQPYLIGRLYFHTGSLHAVQRGDHEEAAGLQTLVVDQRSGHEHHRERLA